MATSQSWTKMRIRKLKREVGENEDSDSDFSHNPSKISIVEDSVGFSSFQKVQYFEKLFQILLDGKFNSQPFIYLAS